MVLAQRAQREARLLNGLEPLAEESVDMVEVLESACRLLARARESWVEEGERGTWATAAPRGGAGRQEKRVRPSGAEPQPSDAESAPAGPREPDDAPGKLDRDPEPSPTARDLIELRDQLLSVFSTDGGANGPLESAYMRLGQVLEHREGLTPIEDTGQPLDPVRQRAAGKRPTRERDQDGLSCRTLQPGYMFNGAVYRQQAVTVYKWEEQK